MYFYEAHAFIAIGFVCHIFAGFAHPTQIIALLVHAVVIDHGRRLETIVRASAGPERVIGPELWAMTLARLAPSGLGRVVLG
jgi:hypothetical protein